MKVLNQIMRKGERTKESILARAAELFNSQGFSGSSLSDIMDATGLQKGGIYNHFENKETLALEAFDYAFKVVSDRLMQALEGKRTPMERLMGIIDFFEGYFLSPPLKGGCIILNTAIESDDTNPALLERSRQAMSLWQKFVRRTIEKGIEQGEMRADLDPDKVATIIIGMFEGGFILSRLHNNTIYLRHIVEHLTAYIEQSVKA